MAKPSGPGDKPSAEVVQLRPTRPCPICKKPSLRAYFPFCSKRCADIDLGRWLKGSYVIPGEPVEEAEETPAPRDGDD